MDATAIKTMRARLEMTQKELADAAGVSQPNVAMWEAGRRRPGEASLKRLAKLSKRRRKPAPIAAAAGKR